MKTLYLNHNGFFEFCKGYGESKTIKFPFNFLRLPPCTPRRFFKDKEIFGFACATGRSAPEAWNDWRYHKIRA